MAQVLVSLPGTTYQSLISLMTTIIAGLAIYGDDLNPNQVTSMLGIIPTKTWLRGDIKNHRTNAVHEYGCWKICTDESGASLEKHVELLMRKISIHNETIVSFADEKSCEIELSVIVKVTEDSPDISLSRAAIKWLCGLKASLDIDTYL
jgi:Domain of unknown function (DUF4279)